MLSFDIHLNYCRHALIAGMVVLTYFIFHETHCLDTVDATRSDAMAPVLARGAPTDGQSAANNFANAVHKTVRRSARIALTSSNRRVVRPVVLVYSVKFLTDRCAEFSAGNEPVQSTSHTAPMHMQPSGSAGPHPVSWPNLTSPSMFAPPPGQQQAPPYLPTSAVPSSNSLPPPPADIRRD
jgi:hypothetical protein